MTVAVAGADSVADPRLRPRESARSCRLSRGASRHVLMNSTGSRVSSPEKRGGTAGSGAGAGSVTVGQHRPRVVGRLSGLGLALRPGPWAARLVCPRALRSRDRACGADRGRGDRQGLRGRAIHALQFLFSVRRILLRPSNPPQRPPFLSFPSTPHLHLIHPAIFETSNHVYL